VVAQRLIRVLCNDCKEPYTPEADTLKRLGLEPEDLKDAVFYKAGACDKCFQSGYRGRVGIYEILVLNEKLQSMIMKTYDSHQLKREAIASGMTTLYQDGIRKALQGITTIEEVLRVTQN
jgi:general secretion pathway protein E